MTTSKYIALLIILLNISLGLKTQAQSTNSDRMNFFSNKLIKVDVISGLKINPSTFFDFFQASGDSLTPVDNFQNPAFYFWRGVCVKFNNQPCVRQLNLADEQKKARAAQIGLNFSEFNVQLDSDMPFENLNFTTTSIFISPTQIELTTKLFDPANSDKIFEIVTRVTVYDRYKDYTVRFSQPQVNGPQRVQLNSISNQFDNVIKAVAQIRLRSKVNLGIHQLDNSHAGTLFFISRSGLAITNYHVLLEKNECLIRSKCEVEIFQSLKGDRNQKITTQIQLMTARSELDFALVKVNLPANFKVETLKFDSLKIGPNLTSFGYPSDKLGALNDGNFQLIQSNGTLTSYFVNSLVTSIFTFHGASGSPILNSDQEVVGIVSHSFDQVNVDGLSTSIIRPAAFIEHAFQINQYVSGEKQKRIDNLISEIQNSNDISVVSGNVMKLIFERSFYGRDRIKNIMIEHSNVQVRRKLADFLAKTEIQ